MIKHKEDSIQQLREKERELAAKDAKISEQEETIELLKGCIMELADVIFGEEVTV